MGFEKTEKTPEFILREALDGPDLGDSLLEHARGTPAAWAAWPLNRCLWYLRKREDLTQAELAGKAGIPRSQIARMEKGEDMRLSTLRKVFGALGYGFLALPCPDVGHPTEAWDHSFDR